MTQNYPPPYPQQYPAAPVPPPMPQVPANVLQYATPGAPMQGATAAWREGSLVVVPVVAELPEVCVKCGAPALGGRWRKKQFWHHPALFLLIIFPGLLIYAIVAICVRKNATVGVGLCENHRAKRTKGIIATTVLALGGAAGLIGGIAIAGNARNGQEGFGVLVVLLGIVMLIASVIVSSRFVRVLYPKKIDGPWAWYAGAGEGFLRGLPVVGQM